MESFLKSASIPHSVATSENFSSLQTSWSVNQDDRKPNVIVLPETAEQVAAAAKHSLSLGQDIAVRGGGHDVYRRWNENGTTLLDLRNLNKVTVDAASQTARVCGGATALQVLTELKAHGFHAAAGGCATVGYVGWALAGGYGSLMNSYGLGADQIVGARVVNAQGDLVDADDRLLQGLRGGGGCLAVVVELVVRIYPINEIQAGFLILESSDIRATVTTLFTGLADLETDLETSLPSELCVFPAVVLPLPGLGLVTGITVVWNGPASDASRRWIQRVAALAPLMPGTPDALTAVAPTTYCDFLAYMGTLFLQSAIGEWHTASVTALTPDVIAGLAESAATAPKEGFVGGFLLHTMRPDNPSLSEDVPASVLPYREPHLMFEILGFGEDVEAAQATAQWALDVRNRFINSNDATRGTYLALTAPKFLDLDKTYGHQLAVLKAIKAEVDPNNVFKHTVPNLGQ